MAPSYAYVHSGRTCCFRGSAKTEWGKRFTYQTYRWGAFSKPLLQENSM